MADDIKEKYINPYTDFGFKKLFEQAEIAKYNEVERRQYEDSLKEYWDYTNTLDTAFNKGELKGLERGREEGRAEGRAEGLERGREEGRVEGRAEGEKQKAVEVATNLKAMGLPTDDIIKVTGLTAQEIEAL